MHLGRGISLQCVNAHLPEISAAAKSCASIPSTTSKQIPDKYQFQYEWYYFSSGGFLPREIGVNQLRFSR
jgi:hypothetical protein